MPLVAFLPWAVYKKMGSRYLYNKQGQQQRGSVTQVSLGSKQDFVSTPIFCPTEPPIVLTERVTEDGDAIFHDLKSVEAWDMGIDDGVSNSA